MKIIPEGKGEGDTIQAPDAQAKTKGVGAKREI